MLFSSPGFDAETMVYRWARDQRSGELQAHRLYCSLTLFVTCHHVVKLIFLLSLFSTCRKYTSFASFLWLPSCVVAVQTYTVPCFHMLEIMDQQFAMSQLEMDKQKLNIRVSMRY